MPIKCFMIDPTDQVRVSVLRCLPATHPDLLCPATGGRHEAEVVIGDMSEADADTIDTSNAPRGAEKCDRCGYRFDSHGWNSIRTRRFYRRQDTGEIKLRSDFPPGAMWFDDPWPNSWAYLRPYTPDGRVLTVQTPGGAWCIDAWANNCTRPRDVVHRCWVRHGEAPNITVDKQGDTCGCGHSIGIGDYHGFLINGELT